jgi:hypothetical protein
MAQKITMSDQQDNREIAHLSKVNAELNASLKRCRVLLDDCRAKLAANSNDPETGDNDHEHAQSESDSA